MNSNDTLDESLIKRTKPVSLFLLALIPLFMGPVIGIATNYLNAEISEEYFEIVMGWDFPGVATLAMFQGAIEGVVYGGIFSFIYTIFVARRNHGRLGNRFFRSIFIRVIIIVLLCWLSGGITGALLFRQYPDLAPDSISHMTYRLFYELERFGWVGGSIWGGIVGGVLALAWAIYRTSRQRA